MMTDVDIVREYALQFAPKHCHVTTVGAPTCFQRHKMFLAFGNSSDFDFVTLPSGTFGHFAKRGNVVTWIRRGTDSLRCLLRDEWNILPNTNLCELVEFILGFMVDNPIKNGHNVVQDVNALRMMDSEYRKIDVYELERVADDIGTTTLLSTGTTHTIRFVSLCGWMHTKQELGWNVLQINAEGQCSVSDRKVISQRIFATLPNIRY